MGPFFLSSQSSLELHHFRRVFIQIMYSELYVLVFALRYNSFEHLAVELGALSQHGQSEGGFDVAPVEQPVEHDVRELRREVNPLKENEVVEFPFQVHLLG